MVSFYLRLGLPSDLFPLQNRICILLVLMRATSPVHIILLDMSVANVLGEEYKL
jgi:hypothetical protein